MINIEESIESYSSLFIDICNDVLESDIEILSSKKVKSASFVQKYNMVTCVDFQGSTNISVIIETQEKIAIKIMDLCDEPSSLHSDEVKSLRTQFGPAFREVINTVSGRLLSFLQSAEETLTIRAPWIVYGEVDFSKAETWCMELETNYGKLNFVISVDDMQLQVVRKLREAESAGKAKTLFLANISHEMRTPLNSILGFTSILLARTDGQLEGNLNIALQKVEKNSKHLLNLINHALDMADLDEEILQIEKIRINIIPIIQNTFDMLNPSAEQKNLSTSCTFPCEEIHVMGDAKRIKQVITNLYSNGIKYTHSGSVNIVTSVEGNDTIRISVADTGIGIRNKDRKKLFQKFVQLDDSYTKEAGGIGLGLAVCVQLAELHDGSIDYDSEINVGSTFSFTLPMCKPDSETTETANTIQ